MIAINRAWEIVGDPARRAAYDRERIARGSPTDEPESAHG
jgi:curved DNA-binding protein CbpA